MLCARRIAREEAIDRLPTGSLVFCGLCVRLCRIQSRCLEFPDAIDETYEEMVENYVESIKRVQPDGPYNLVGYSLGGLLSYSIACRLQEEGLDVDVLGLIDSYPSSGSSRSEMGDQAMYTVLAQRYPGILDQDNVVRAWKHNSLVGRHFRKSSFRGSILFFRAAIKPRGCPRESWEARPGCTIEVYDVQSEHGGMMDRESLSVVGKVLNLKMSE